MQLDSKKLKAVCKKEGVKLKEVLDRAKISKTAYYNLIRKKLVVPKSLMRLAGALNVELKEIVSFYDSETQAVLCLQMELDKICRDNPGIDRENAWHTLLLLSESPLERLQRSLLRGQSINIY